MKRAGGAARLSTVLVPLLVLAAPAYRIVDLGLPPSAKSSEAVAINNRGEVLISTEETVAVPYFNTEKDKGVAQDPVRRGYLWRAGNFLAFGKPIDSRLTGDPGSVEPRALNDLGIAVGGEGGFGPIFMTGLTDSDAFIWRGRGLENLSAGGTAEAKDINNLGDVVGSNGHGAFARLGGRIVALPEASRVEPRDPNGEMGDVNRSSAVAINDHRQILMDSTYSGKHGSTELSSRPFLVDGARRPFRMVPVPMPKGTKEAAGLDLNERGEVLARATLSDHRYAPYLAVGKGITMLPYSEGVMLDCRLNRRRDVVATMTVAFEPKFSYAPALWLGGRRVPFPTFPGWTLQTAAGINDKGQICGTGLHEGKRRAYALLPRH